MSRRLTKCWRNGRKLSEVALHAGVSEATVSRVLNGRAGISELTRAAVLTAVDVVGYERPAHLRLRRARMVGLVIPELQTPIFPVLADTVAGALAQRGFSAVLGTPGSLSEADYVEMLLERQVSGIIFADGQYADTDAPHDHYQRLLALRLPVMVVNAAAKHLGFPRVSTDEAVAVEQAHSHLVGLRHEQIGLVLGPVGHVASARKLKAFERLTAEMVSPPLVERTRLSIDGGRAAGTRLIDAGATGIICANDLVALGVIRATRRSGLLVPRDVSVVGYGDSMLMSCTAPALTTVRQPIESIGRAAVEILVGQIKGSPASSDELFFEPELVVRGSTAPRPGGDPGSSRQPGPDP